jgi:TnpA family transposase
VRVPDLGEGDPAGTGNGGEAGRVTPLFGSGTLSSSDGQRFPTRGKSITARALSRYFAHEGLTTYTHVTDQHTTYGTKIIVAAKREAHYVLDEILGDATDIPITEHATDTHGVTLVNFGLFDLLGLQLSPRIRDLGKITLYRTEPKWQVTSAFPLAGQLLTRRANLDLSASDSGSACVRAGGFSFGGVGAPGR